MQILGEYGMFTAIGDIIQALHTVVALYYSKTLCVGSEHQEQ